MIFFFIHKKNGVSDSNSLKMACIGLILGSRKLFCQAVILWNLEKSGLCRIPFYSKNFYVFIFRQKIFTNKTRFLIRSGKMKWTDMEFLHFLNFLELHVL